MAYFPAQAVHNCGERCHGFPKISNYVRRLKFCLVVLPQVFVEMRIAGPLKVVLYPLPPCFSYQESVNAWRLFSGSCVSGCLNTHIQFKVRESLRKTLTFANLMSMRLMLKLIVNRNSRTRMVSWTWIIVLPFIWLWLVFVRFLTSFLPCGLSNFLSWLSKVYKQYQVTLFLKISGRTGGDTRAQQRVNPHAGVATSVKGCSCSENLLQIDNQDGPWKYWKK